MNVLEQHVEVTRGLNHFGGNRSRKFNSDEIDLALNKMMDRFIRSCLKSKDNGGFEVDQVKADDIQPLIVSRSSLVPYIVDDTRYKCYLPHDYKYLLSDSSVVADLSCGNIATKQARTLFLTALRQERSAKTTARWYVTNTVSMSGTTINIPGDLPYGNTFIGFNSRDDLIFMVPYIALRGGWYWERAGDHYYPGHYIRLSHIAPEISRVTVDGTDYNSLTELVLPQEVHTNTGAWVSNRLTASNLIPDLLPDAIYGTKHYSPISELSGNILYVYRDTNYTISGVTISYVRKPQPISLSLNTSCELPDNAAQIICDLTVEHIKGRLENAAGQQLAERDIDRRVTL